MTLSLKLELKSDSLVLVTNIETREQIEVTLNFLKKITKSSLAMLIQDRYYELIIDAEKYWSGIKKFQPGLESTIIKEVEQKDFEEIENIRNNVKRQIREAQIAKQQRWDEIAAYKKAQRYNRLSTVIQYADYCLKHDDRYSYKENADRDTNLKINLDLSMKEIIALKRENQALRETIAELEAKYIDSEIVSVKEEIECMLDRVAE